MRYFAQKDATRVGCWVGKWWVGKGLRILKNRWEIVLAGFCCQKEREYDGGVTRRGGFTTRCRALCHGDETGGRGGLPHFGRGVGQAVLSRPFGCQGDHGSGCSETGKHSGASFDYGHAGRYATGRNGRPAPLWASGGAGCPQPLCGRLPIAHVLTAPAWPDRPANHLRHTALAPRERPTRARPHPPPYHGESVRGRLTKPPHGL